MDPERAKRRQSLKVIVSESIMVLAVIIIVTILGFLVSGYWINSDFKIERQGLLQISSIPTGADVFIDDNDSSWLQRTNTSKILPSGKHTIKLSKEGYDSWSKTVNIPEGLLYRIHYPRLFPIDRTKEEILETNTTTLATVSPNHNYLLLINNTTEWELLNLDNDDVKSTKINISSLFSEANSNNNAEKSLFTGEIIQANWDHDNNHILLKIKIDNSIEWILLDVKNVKNSINISKEFGSNFTEIKIIDNSASNLLAIQNNNLHKINIPGKSLSNILVEGIVNFDHFENDEVVFTAKDDSANYYIGLLEINNEKINKLMDVDVPAKVVLNKFYDDKYITILKNNTVTVLNKNNSEKGSEFELTFTPNTLSVGHDGEFIIMTLGSQIATLDMESMSILEWQTDGEHFGWLDNDMIYSVSNNDLIVYDYDGLNRRIIANNVSNHFPVIITADKWLYYFSDNILIRESIK